MDKEVSIAKIRSVTGTDRFRKTGIWCLKEF